MRLSQEAMRVNVGSAGMSSFSARASCSRQYLAESIEGTYSMEQGQKDCLRQRTLDN